MRVCARARVSSEKQKKNDREKKSVGKSSSPYLLGTAYVTTTMTIPTWWQMDVNKFERGGKKKNRFEMLPSEIL